MMPDIVHRIGVAASPSRVYRAIATRSGLINWWTWHVIGEPSPGPPVRFRFARGGADMEMRELTPDRRIVWRCVSGPVAWVDTEIVFSLSPNEAAGGRETVILFSHKGWREAGEFMAHCNTEWAYFLLSLMGWVEDGRGTPFPENRKISSWG
jgi:uncharacterized protein YndB with AHSA1/START domain